MDGCILGSPREKTYFSMRKSLRPMAERRENLRGYGERSYLMVVRKGSSLGSAPPEQHSIIIFITYSLLADGVSCRSLEEIRKSERWRFMQRVKECL